MKPSAPILRPEIADPGRIRVGAGYKLLPQTTPPAAVNDSGRIRLGAGYRLGAARSS